MCRQSTARLLLQSAHHYSGGPPVLLRSLINGQRDGCDNVMTIRKARLWLALTDHTKSKDKVSSLLDFLPPSSPQPQPHTHTYTFNAAPQDGILASSSSWFLHRLAFLHFSCSSSFRSILFLPHFCHQHVSLWSRRSLFFFSLLRYVPPLWSCSSCLLENLQNTLKKIGKIADNQISFQTRPCLTLNTQAPACPPRVRIFTNHLPLAEVSIHFGRTCGCLEVPLSDRCAFTLSFY